MTHPARRRGHPFKVVSCLLSVAYRFELLTVEGSRLARAFSIQNKMAPNIVFKGALNSVSFHE